MPLIDVAVPAREIRPPREVRVFLREARRRIQRFQRERSVPAFLPGDFPLIHSALRWVAESDLCASSSFCEWGSGFGVVACLAAMLDFEAAGIEIEPELVESARELADDFQLPVEFECGNFIPRGDRTCFERPDAFSWLSLSDDCGHEKLGLTPADFGLVFAYPWPDEEWLVEELFERHAADGALFMTYDSTDVRLRKKVESQETRVKSQK